MKGWRNKLSDYSIQIKRKEKKDMSFERENLHLIIQNGVPFLSFTALEKIPFIRHGFSTRLGGVSEGIYQSMNFREDGIENTEHVRENYKRMADALGLCVEKFVRCSLVHGTNIYEVTKKDYGKGVLCPTDLTGIDGMITKEKGLTLVTTYADCVPLYFVDKKKKVIGLSHSGWKGTKDKIGAFTIQAMKKSFQCEPEDIIVCIGPSICNECYEVGEDVKKEFEKNFTETELQEIFSNRAGRKYQLDLWKANELLLLEAGIKKENLFITDICTCCNSELLFSHRATKGKRGNLGAFLAIAQEE